MPALAVARITAAGGLGAVGLESEVKEHRVLGDQAAEDDRAGLD